jgi:dihydrofolate reductase
MSVLVINHVSLDGVLQAPGRVDEDPSGGFRHGGWVGSSGADPELNDAVGEHMQPGFHWLFGRRSYDDMLSHWNEVGGPFRDGLNETPKHVATASAKTELRWPNSTAITGDVPAEVARLSASHALVVMGSSQLVHTLIPHGLVDELLLFVHPVVLGSGKRLFGHDDAAHHFTLTASRTSTSGVVVMSYSRQ